MNYFSKIRRWYLTKTIKGIRENVADIDGKIRRWYLTKTIKGIRENVADIEGKIKLILEIDRQHVATSREICEYLELIIEWRDRANYLETLLNPTQGN